MDYSRAYDNLMTRAQERERPEGYAESHHILPRCMKGPDVAANRVWLTAREHYVAHQLLVKIHPGHHGLLYAAMMMTRRGRSQGRVGNRYYAWLKARYSESQSVLMKERLRIHGNPSQREDVKELRRQAWSGEKNPSYGRPNLEQIEALAAAKRGKSHADSHSKAISSSISRWHAQNPDRHPMKNPETVAKAVASRRKTWLAKKGIVE